MARRNTNSTNNYEIGPGESRNPRSRNYIPPNTYGTESWEPDTSPAVLSREMASAQKRLKDAEALYQKALKNGTVQERRALRQEINSSKSWIKGIEAHQGKNRRQSSRNVK